MEIRTNTPQPPHLRFFRDPVEDREASIAAGHFVSKETDMVTVTPIGSRDSVTKPVLEYFANLRQQVQQDRFAPDWLMSYEAKYEMWKKGLEMPVEGTPIRSWPVATPGEVKTCTELLILTVEQLAQANDEAVRRIGMGGLALKQRAIKYLEAANGPGKLTARIVAVEQENNTLKTRNANLEERIAKLEAMVGAQNPVKVTEKPEMTSL